MNLPDGAIAQLGKGQINEVAFSPRGDILAVATSIWVWLHDTETYKESNFRHFLHEQNAMMIKNST